MPDIIDNRNQKLVDHIVNFIKHSEQSRFAVGYLFLSGLEAIGDALINLNELKMLIGNVSNKDTIETLAEGYKRLDLVTDKAEEYKYLKKQTQKKNANATLDDIRDSIELMDQSDGEENIIKVIIRLIAEKKLKVKVYTKGRLHAKAYIFDWKNKTPTENGIAIVGSSNLSLAGIQDNTELNVLVHDNASPTDPQSGNHAALVNWFDELWNDSLDFDEALMAELSQSWAVTKVTPYDIYMKTLYTLVADRLEDKDAGEILWNDEITEALADFQKVAVRQAIKMIRRYDGCFVADVVGLGKSFIGAGIVKHFERTEHARPVIFCPKALEDMWTRYNETYHLNANIFSISMLQSDDNRGINLLTDVRTKDRDFVLIDESHHFRNRGSQRYLELEKFLATGKKVCLLTATPRNSRITDVLNQIKLFHPEDMTDLPIDPPNLKEYFKLIENKERRLQDILTHVLIRRTRRHVLRWYGFTNDTNQPLSELTEEQCKPYLDGPKKAYVIVNKKHQYFPKRELEPLRYNINDTYNGLYQDLRKFLGKPAGEGKKIEPGKALTYARYGIWNYVVELLQKVEPYSNLHRAGINLRGLIRTSLFKRLESSVYAFRVSLERMLNTHEVFLKALEKGFVPAGEDADALLGKIGNLDDEDLLIALQDVSKVYETKDFILDKLMEHISADIDILKKMIKMVEPITPEMDNKLQAFKQQLQKTPIKGNKCIIFTQFADTAEYLYKNLNPDNADPEIDQIFGNDKSKARMAWSFSPKANTAYSETPPKIEIRLLVATDVMSEGLNLQDCSTVLNYDLHWNPVRLIQRFGRIDRIGSEHDKVYGFNFLPETALEQQLGIKAVLRERIKEIHETIGEDSAILDKSEKLNEESMYAIYDSKILEDKEDDDLMDLNEAEEYFRQMMKSNPEELDRIKNMRLGIRCARKSNENRIYLFGKAGNYSTLSITDENGKVISKDLANILETIKAPKTEEPDKLPKDYNSRVVNSKKKMDEEYKILLTDRGFVGRYTKSQRYVLDELRRLYKETEDENTKDQIDEMQRAFKITPTSAINKELNLIRKNSMAGEFLLNKLIELYLQHKIKDRMDQAKEREKDGILRIVCSELV